MLSRRTTGDSGVTLVELVVGMTLATIVGAISIQFFVGTTAQASRVGEQSLDSASARSAMSQIVRTLQVADSATASPGSSASRFVTVNPNEVEFYANVSATNRSGTTTRSAPTEFDFSLNNGTIVESIYQPTSATAPASYPTTPTSKITLLTGVVNGSTPLFTYCSDTTDPSTTCTTTTNQASVALVQVSISEQGLTGGAAQVLQTGVAIQGQMS